MNKGIKNKSVYKMQYKLCMKIKSHAIMSTRELIVFKEIFDNICFNHGIECKSMYIEKQVVVVEFKAKPDTELLKFINAYKSAVSRKIKSICKDLCTKDGFWEKGYLLVTVGKEDTDLLKDYISMKNSQV